MALLTSVAVYAHGHYDGNRVESGALSVNVVDQNPDYRYLRDVDLYIYNINTSQYVYMEKQKLYQDSRGRLYVSYTNNLVLVMDTDYRVRRYFRYCFFGVFGTMYYFN